jgi:UDPglucose 6-dehydrogenase
MTMRVGFVGVGLLGLPLARAVASRGYRVLGFDLNPDRMSDRWFQGELADGEVEYVDLDRLVSESEIVFVCVDTPHASGYDGTVPFELEENLGYRLEPLKLALSSLAERLPGDERKSVVICSTVLPGTVARLRLEVGGLDDVDLVYNPSFTASGTVTEDFFDPEFVILGSDDESSARRVR